MERKINLIVNNAIKSKPNNATNIRIITKKVYNEKERWYEHNIFARYDTPNGQTEVEIEKCGDWMDTEPSNYILACLGEYHPFSRDNYDTIKGHYESFLDSGMIENPIQSITSTKWQIKSFCEEIIKNQASSVEMTLWFDEKEINTPNHRLVCDKRHTWSEFKQKQYFCAKITIKYDNKVHTTDGGFYSEYISLINKCGNAFEKHNIDYTVNITDKEYEKWCRFHNWNDLEFDDPRFNLL